MSSKPIPDSLDRTLVQMRSAFDELQRLVRDQSPNLQKNNSQGTFCPAGVYKHRRDRDKIFGTKGLFGEPAWDILLDLSIADSEGRILSVSDVCVGACCPPTTALRYIAALEEDGLIVRLGDLSDGRRKYLQLTGKARTSLQRLFAGSEFH